MSGAGRVAYVVGRYPAVSHTFVTREVQAVRAAGVEVETISIHRAADSDALSAVDQAERDETYWLLPLRKGRFLRAHLRALCSPGAYLRTLRTALRGEVVGIKGRIWRIFYFAEAIMVWDHCRRRGVRHVHAHHLNQASDAAMLAALYGNARGAGAGWTWSFTMHGPNEFYDVSRFRLAEKAASAAFVACISDFARSQVMGFVPEDRWPRLRIVHCGVDPDQYDPQQVDRREREGGFHILYVGRLVPFKGQGLLLDALARLRADGIDASVTLIGEGPSRSDLESKAQSLGLGEHVEFAGAVGQDEIRSYFAAADAFCLPSFAEGVPVVLMEAMAMEVPVVTTAVMGIPELVEGGADGLLVRPGRIEDLSEALSRLATEPELRRSLGARARKKVQAQFDVRDAGRNLAEIFRAEAEA
jgi:colanic acid/amylovoran biosynthesis glycosyltransferase